MTNFEFVFSLFSLLLGLSIAEVLGGFGRVVQRREKLTVGVLLPLLGLLILLDVSSFWLVAWSVRDALPIAYFPMMIGLLICGLYYLVATLTFPHELSDWLDLDTYYFGHKHLVVGGMIACNALALASVSALGVNPLATLHSRISIVVFLLPAAALFMTRHKGWNVALLAFMTLQYPLGAALQMVGW